MPKTKRVRRGGAAPRKKGDAFERRVKKHLQDKGLFVVRQSASAFPDLIAVNYPDVLRVTIVWAVECKMAKRINKEEKAKLLALDQEYGMIPVIAYKGPKGKILFCDVDYKDLSGLA